ncbi:MAG TPA: DUF368 domain-containing protein [Bacillota bacterium]
MEWKNVYRGLLMGASDVIPGVSGGTIALLLGIYDRLIASINGLMTKEWKKQLGFLIPLGIGIGTSILLLSKVIHWLLEHYPGPLQFFFLGLIIGILPNLFQEADVKNTFQWQHYVLLFLGIMFVAALAGINVSEGSVIESRDLSTYIFLFVAGFLGSAAMILPGISGSMILLVIGAYYTVIHAVSNLYFDVLVVVGLGIVIGIVVMSKMIKFFLIHYKKGTYALVIGFVLGSLIIVFPGWPIDEMGTVLSVVTFAFGLFIAYILGKVEYDDE